jgi:hypothetical protein
MKINSELHLINRGEFSKSEELKQILTELRIAIKTVNWGDEKEFIINPTYHGNGVVPIKSNFIKALLGFGWVAEKRMSFAVGMGPGPIDMMKETKYGHFAVEWETGNISSSHRALSKMAVGIIQDVVLGGILILPTKQLAYYLTDRIGSYNELAPYFALYENVIVDDGYLGVISIDFDAISIDSPLIPKGKDGNAKKL